MVILIGEVGTDITLQKIATAVSNGETEFMLNSYGGSLLEGLAIRDYLKNADKEITITGIGIVASSATLIMSGAKRRLSSNSAKYVLHNPTTHTQGDATAIEKTVVDLRNFENEIANIYSSFGSATQEQFLALMKEDKMISAQEALALGLVTEIQDISNNLYKQTNQTKTKKPMETNAVKQFIKGFSKFLGFKNYVAQAGDGTTLDFGADVADESQIKIGVYCSADNGTYVLPSGTSVTVESNIVTDIVPATSNKEAEAQVTQLTNKITELTNKISEITTQLATKDSEIESVKSEAKQLYTDFQNAVNELKSEKSKFSGGTAPELIENTVIENNRMADNKKNRAINVFRKY